MLVDIDHWVPGDDVDDDAQVIEELRKLRAEDFNHEQKSRVAALKASREVLAERSGGPFTSNVKTVDTLDLVAVAGWIIDGEDPWRPKTVLGDLPMPGVMNKAVFKDEVAETLDAANFAKNEEAYKKESEAALRILRTHDPDESYPNGRCWRCGFGLDKKEVCNNPDCIETSLRDSSEKGSKGEST